MSAKSSETAETRNAPIWIKMFVALHIVCITMWALPYPKKPYMQGTASFGINTSSPANFTQSTSELVTQGFLYLNWKYIKGSPLMYYPGTVGFWQFWDMFAPNPASIDLYLTANVKFQDGSTKPFDYPRIYNLSIPLKYVKERYRKFYENACADDQAYCRPFVAQRIALESFTDPNNPPVQVDLIHHRYVIAPPGEPQSPDYSAATYFTYVVDVPKLRHDKGLTP